MPKPLSFAVPKSVLQGDVCTVRLTVAGGIRDPHEKPRLAWEQAKCEEVSRRVGDSVSQSLGCDFHAREVYVDPQQTTIRVTVATDSHVITNSRDFVRSLRLLVCHLRDLVASLCEEGTRPVNIRAYWSSAPPLIRLQAQPPEDRTRILEALQRPLSLLVLGSLIGSWLIPDMEARANRHRARHDERIKMAVMVVEQSQETNKGINNLMTDLEMFGKNHTAPSESPKLLRKDQEVARAKFDALYEAFNSQAWSWYRALNMEVRLASLATHSEAERISALVDDYDKSVVACTRSMDDLLNHFLREKYKPGDPSNKVLLETTRRNLSAAEVARGNKALEIAKILASD